MKILLINPNSDKNMTKEIYKTAEQFVQGRYTVICKPTPGASEFIETYEDIIRSGPGMMQMLRSHKDVFDAFIIACHYDPNLDVMKKITAKPVVGIGEASLKLATMLGHRFSIITTDKHSIPIHEELVRKYHLQGAMASIRAPDREDYGKNDKERFLLTARTAIQKDRAEVIVLGCAGMAGMNKFLTENLGVPVLDGIVCALIIAAGLVNLSYL